ncbi:MAG TPA: PAC2 family protein [Myxococcota bacterium]|nr:PAC2 family protein [Myxococcota bacterium]
MPAGAASICNPADMPPVSDEIRFDVEPALEAPALILAFQGWNDAGDAASNAAEFIANALGAAPLGEIDGEHYYDFTVQRPVVEQGEHGRRTITWPRFALRYAVIPGRTELVIGVGPEPHTHWRKWCDEMVRMARKLRVSRIVLLGAFLADVVYSLPVHVTGFAWPPERMEELGLRASNYEGPTGIVGVLGSVYPEAGLETVAFWAGLPHYIPLTPNPRGTLALVQMAARYLDLPIDRTPLEREAAEYEGKTSELVAADPQLAEYVRELKKRGFAQ